MPTPAERQALLFLASILALGTGLRIVRGRTPAPSVSARQSLAGQLAAVDSAIAMRGRMPRSPSGRGVSRATPSAPRQEPPVARADRPTPRRGGTPPVGREPALVDLDTATESLLVTLPGIGPVLARRIVQDRDRAGAFGSLSALTRVSGIGEKLAARLAPLVTFSRSPRRSR